MTSTYREPPVRIELTTARLRIGCERGNHVVSQQFSAGSVGAQVAGNGVIPDPNRNQTATSGSGCFARVAA